MSRVEQRLQSQHYDSKLSWSVISCVLPRQPAAALRRSRRRMKAERGFINPYRARQVRRAYEIVVKLPNARGRSLFNLKVSVKN